MVMFISALIFTGMATVSLHDLDFANADAVTAYALGFHTEVTRNPHVARAHCKTLARVVFHHQVVDVHLLILKPSSTCPEFTFFCGVNAQTAQRLRRVSSQPSAFSPRRGFTKSFKSHQRQNRSQEWRDLRQLENGWTMTITVAISSKCGFCVREFLFWDTPGVNWTIFSQRQSIIHHPPRLARVRVPLVIRVIGNSFSTDFQQDLKWSIYTPP